MANKGNVVTLPTGKRAKLGFVLERYHRAHPDVDPAMVEPHLVAEWAIRTGIYAPEPRSPEELLRRDISRYLKTEYMIDPQGREVRKYHAVVYETSEGMRRSRSYEMNNAPPDHMIASLGLRRRSALRDVLQLNLDFESYNDNNRFGATIPPMDFNFNPDVEEAKLPTTYPEAPDDDDLDDDI